MKNSHDMINAAQKVFELLETGKVGVAEANTLNNSIGVMVKTAKLKMEYNKYMGKKEEIEFLKK